MSRPRGIRASFAQVAFKKDGAVVYETQVTDGGCFGPEETSSVISYAFKNLQRSIEKGDADKKALDFNGVSIRHEGGRTQEFAIEVLSEGKLRIVGPVPPKP